MHSARAALAALSLLALAWSAPAADTVAGWRTDGTGRCPEAQPPLAWAVDKNVLWKTPLPAWSNASPVLTGDRLFMCAEPATLLCVSAKDGAILWQKPNSYADILPPAEAAKAVAAAQRGTELATRQKTLEKELRDLNKPKPKDAAKVAGNDKDQAAAAPDPAIQERIAALKKEIEGVKKESEGLGEYRLPVTHDTNGYASPTPVTDGKRVFVVFGNGVVAAYDLDGQRLWARLVEKPSHVWGHSASPVLSGDRLIVHIQKLYALDAASGKEVWTFATPIHWGSPLPARIGDTDVVVTTNGDVLRTADGVALIKGVCGLEFNTPILQDGVVYFIQNGGKALKLPASAAAPVAQPEILWTTTPEKDRYYSSPLWHDGLIYCITRGNVFSIIDAATGAVVHTRKLDLGGTAYPSITLVGKHILVSSDTGKTAVLEPGREAKEVGRNSFEPFRTTPVFAGKRFYVRTLKALYCIGE